ncbi:NADH dehydrogenase [ubiquinone] 1 beta subcomplex subunit 4 [Episyrphus balteatus]|uniref:NADH dehydrogenase [ubiquinone] 1 beta subcomplex subunit 4 n=1 Tax=Episyrphus balteatus TaxID=286459 RepID=UPI002484F6BE|nr:NADH dehydrogenase [ubiquinone] 1 beta subcomplex subunit 4 [Episyrphus balteatus]
MPEMSTAEKQLLLKKHERASKLRAEFQKQITNPHRHATGEGGTVFDAGMQRFQAMRVNFYEHFRPTTKATRTGLLIVVLPICAFAMGFKADRDAKEQKFRTGQVAYKDRQFKFI